MLTFRRAIRPALIAAAKAADGLDRNFTRNLSAAASAHPERVRRLLLWSMNSLGDVLRATPAIAALRARYPDAHVTMVAASRAAPILRHNPNVDHLIEIPNPYDLRAHRRALRQLAGETWDLAVLLEVNRYWTLVESLYLRWLQVPRWICFDFGQGVRHRATGVPLGTGSWIDQFNTLATTAGAHARSTAMQIHLLPGERETAASHLRSRGLDPQEPFFLVHPGANVMEVSRRWPQESFAQLLTAMWRRWQWPVVMTGTAPEQPIIDAIRSQTEARVIDLCGELGMRQLAATIEMAHVCIMNDTGPLHIAHALRRPTIAILGPTGPEVVGVPETTEIVRVDLPCSPCAGLAGWKTCTNSNRWECLQRVTPEMVLAGVARLISRRVRLPILDADLQWRAQGVLVP